jgi:hypothetical protein
MRHIYDTDHRRRRLVTSNDQKYMLILGGADLDKRSGNPDFRSRMIERYMAWVQALRDSGRLVASVKLHDQTGRRLTVRGGEVIDGPFVESKDAVGGVFVIAAASLDEATELARSCPVLDLQRGYVEVRAIESRQVAAAG